MKTFRYTATYPSGKTLKDTIDAETEFDAVSRIKDGGGTLLTIEEIKAKSNSALAKSLNEPLSISEKTLSLIASQFAILVRAGIQMARAVQIVAEQTTDKYLKKVFNEVAGDVAAGFPLAQSLETRSSKIPVAFIENIRAGEESGAMEFSFEKLKSYYEKSYKLRAKVKSAMTYPIMLIILSIVVIVIVVNVTVPVMAEMITSGGGELPGPTKILLAMYDFTNQWWPVMLAVVVAFVIAYKLYDNTEAGHLKLAEMQLKIPVIGRIALMNNASQFANTMATLLSSGMPMTRALAATGKVIDNYAAAKTVKKAVKGIEEGRRLGAVMRGNDYFPKLLIEMTDVGEEAGTLAETLQTIGNYFDSEAEEASAKALGLMEPLITVILGGVIGFIVIALYMPMFSMYNSI